MAALSISTAWNETAAFVKRDAGALFTIAFALMALPSVAMQALGPGQMAPGQTPGAGLWMLMLPIVLVLSIAGSLAISSLAMGRENVVGSAIAHGFRRVLPMIGATLLVGLAAMVVFVPLILIAGLTPENLTAPSPASAGRLLLVMLLFLVIFLFFWVRLMLMTPAAAAEGLGPIGIIRRSWQLTSGHFGKLLGFTLLFLVAAMVVMMVITMLIGILVALVAGRPEPGSVSALLMLLLGGVLNAVFVVFFTTMIARIYLQLSGTRESAAFD
jgi:hypothetical protein